MNNEPADREWDDRPRRRDDDWDDRHSYRRRFGDERDDYDEPHGYGDARRKVQPPAIALMIVGTLGILCSLFVIGLGVWMGIELSNNRGQPDDIVAVIVLSVCGVLGIAMFALIVLGGARMRQCRSWGLALTAAIIAISSIALFGLCSIFILPFGIWALVVLANPDVKKEFQRVAHHGRSSADDWDDESR